MEVAHYVGAGVVRVLSITLLILILIWIVKYREGFAVKPEDTGPGVNSTFKLFNWHPLLMFLAFPVLMTEAILTYSAFPLNIIPRFWKKVVHGGIQAVVLAIVALGLVAVFQSHNLKKPHAIYNMYSPHSYVGITVVTALTIQFVGGMLLFVFRVFPEELKNQIVPYHHFMGTVAYFSAIAAMLMGIQEAVGFGYDKDRYEPEDILINVVCILLILLATAVTFHRSFLRWPKEQPERAGEEISPPLMGEDDQE